MGLCPIWFGLMIVRDILALQVAVLWVTIVGTVTLVGKVTLV